MQGDLNHERLSRLWPKYVQDQLPLGVRSLAIINASRPVSIVLNHRNLIKMVSGNYRNKSLIELETNVKT